MIEEQVDHYAILYEDERNTRYTVFASTDLNTLGNIFAKMLQFESIFRTFPNMSCHLCLEKDYNYDPDLGAFRMDAIPFMESHKWSVLIDEIIHDYSYVLDSPRR